MHSCAEEHGPTTISIPDTLYHRLEERIQGSGFTSVEDYVTYILQQVLAEEDSDLGPTQEDDASARNRLAGLGYV